MWSTSSLDLSITFFTVENSTNKIYLEITYCFTSSIQSFPSPILLRIIFPNWLVFSKAVQEAHTWTHFNFFVAIQVYPTYLRSVGVGVCSGMARLGAMVTPFVAQVMVKTSLSQAIGLYTGVALLAVGASLLLPIETKGRAMQWPAKARWTFSSPHQIALILAIRSSAVERALHYHSSYGSIAEFFQLNHRWFHFGSFIVEGFRFKYFQQ